MLGWDSVISSHPKHTITENSNQAGTYDELEGVWVDEEASEGCRELSGTSIPPSMLSNEFSLLLTSLLCRSNSSIIIDNAVLQDSSSLNAKVHLPSTRAFVLAFPWVMDLAGSKTGKVDGRIRKCNHLECFSSIAGWWHKSRKIKQL